MPSQYYSEGEGRRPRWKFWRSKSGDISHSHSHSNSTGKKSSSRSDESYRDAPSNYQTFENASLPGQLITNVSSDASSDQLKESTASPSLNPRSLSTSSIAPVEHTKTTSTSTSSPVVTRETHTDPLTGDLIITMTTTIVTTTTTKRIIKIPPATHDEVDLDEERRLAAEYLASNGMQSPKDPHAHFHPRHHPGLHPAPRRAGSHSNLISRSSEQSSSTTSYFGPRPATSDRSYSMGSRTGPPPTFGNYGLRNFSRPGPTSKQAGGEEEAQTRMSLDARRGLKRAESMRSKSLILRKPADQKSTPANQQTPAPDAEHQPQNYSHSIDTIAHQNTRTRPHTRDGGEKWPGGSQQRQLTSFHRPRFAPPASPRIEETELSPSRRSWGTFGGQGGMKHQQQQQATKNFILGIPSTGGHLGNMF